MNFFVIDDPPSDAAEYVKVPSAASEDEFVGALVRLFRQGIANICTEPVSIDWATKAYQLAEVRDAYNVLVVRAPVNAGKFGTAQGMFYFQQVSEE